MLANLKQNTKIRRRREGQRQENTNDVRWHATYAQTTEVNVGWHLGRSTKRTMSPSTQA